MSAQYGHSCVKSACENDSGNYTYTQTQMYCVYVYVCVLWACARMSLHTRVSERRRKLAFDIAPKRGPLSSQTQARWILISAPE